MTFRRVPAVAILALTLILAGCPYESPVPLGTQRLPAADELLGAWIPTRVDQADVPDSLGLVYMDITQTSEVDLTFEYRATTGDVRSMEESKQIDLVQEAFVTDLSGVPILNVREGDKYKFYRFAVDEPFLKLWSIEKRHFKDSEDELIVFKDPDCLLDYAAPRMERDGFFSEDFDVYVRKHPAVAFDVVLEAGVAAYEDGRYGEALSWFEAASHLELPSALTYMGYLYEQGWGAKADTSRAMRHYERAAWLGDTTALAHLGALVYEGHVPGDEGGELQHRGGPEALAWWKSAVQQNDPVAYYHLGLAYADGIGVQQDVVRARSYLRRADSLGYEPAGDVKTMVDTSPFLASSQAIGSLDALLAQTFLQHYEPALRRAAAVCNGGDEEGSARQAAVEALEESGLDVLAARFTAGREAGCTTLVRLEDVLPPLLLLPSGAEGDPDYLPRLEEQVRLRRELLPGDGIGRFLLELFLSHQHLAAGNMAAAGQAFERVLALPERVDYSHASTEQAAAMMVLRLVWEAMETIEPKVAMQYAALLWQSGDPRASQMALRAAQRLEMTQQRMADMNRGHPLLSQLSSLDFTMPDVATMLLPVMAKDEAGASEAYEQLAAWKGEALKGLRIQSIVMRQAKEQGLDSVATKIRLAQERLKAAYFQQDSASVVEWKHVFAEQDSLYKVLIEGVFFGGDPVEAVLDAAVTNMPPPPGASTATLEGVSGMMEELSARMEAGALSKEEALSEVSTLFGELLNVVSFETMIPEMQAEADPWDGGGLERLRARMDSGAVFIDVYQHFSPEAFLRPSFLMQGLDAPEARDSARYAAVVVTKAQGPVRIDLGERSTIDEAVAAWRAALTARDGLREGRAVADLMDALWAPIVDVLPGGTRRLWVSPDGRLAQLPWNWMTDQHPETWGLEVAHVPSARALLRLLTTRPAETPPDVLLVGDVNFGDDAPFAHLPALPATEGEVREASVLAAAAGLDPVVLTGRAATREAVTEVLPSARYAHLATHGFFAGDQSVPAGNVRSALGEDAGPDAAAMQRDLAAKVPLIESGLALAGANDGPHGLLTAEELASLDLSGAQLIVLSACDTGRGTEVTGQGVMGLRASLLSAGARSLLLSLWKVPDESTALLMKHFYRGLWERGLSPAAALREAQTQVQPTYPDPIFWAAWVLDGAAWPLSP